MHEHVLSVIQYTFEPVGQLALFHHLLVTKRVR